MPDFSKVRHLNENVCNVGGRVKDVCNNSEDEKAKDSAEIIEIALLDQNGYRVIYNDQSKNPIVY